jgi:hypothetical protein
VAWEQGSLAGSLAVKSGSVISELLLDNNALQDHEVLVVEKEIRFEL